MDGKVVCGEQLQWKTGWLGEKLGSLDVVQERSFVTKLTHAYMLAKKVAQRNKRTPQHEGLRFLKKVAQTIPL